MVLVNSTGQEFLPAPNMISQSASLGRCPAAVSLPIREALGLLPQGRVGTKPIVLEKSRADCRIPSLSFFSKGMCLPGQTSQPIPQHPVEALLVDGVGALHYLPHHYLHLNPHHSPPAAALHCLDEPHPRRGLQGWPPTLPPSHGIPVNSPHLPPTPPAHRRSGEPLASLPSAHGSFSPPPAPLHPPRRRRPRL